MNLKDLQNKSLGELQKLLLEERARLRDLRFQVAAEQHKQVHELGQCRKAIARILTLLKQKTKPLISDKELTNKKELN
jgi:large subunit ribosomal protein L29